MTLLLAIIASVMIPRLIQHLAIVLVDALTTLVAALYYWRRERLWRAIGAASTSRRSTHLLAKHLRLSIAMTAHYSLFPQSAQRGYALAQGRPT